MSLRDRNLFLQILHKNGATRKQVDYIMKDIDSEDIFEEMEEYGYLDDIEEVADILFNPNSTTKEKKDAVNSLKTDEKIRKIAQRGRIVVTEKMIKEKQREYIKMGIVREDKEEDSDVLEEEYEELGNSRYGRSPLHEAIAFRNLEFVKKCIKENKYLDEIDNSGNTPREMAYYEGWFEVLKLFDKVKS